MKKLLWLLLLLPTLAQAADNTVILTPGTGVTMRTIDIGAGVQSSGVNLVGSTGASILGTAGTANANVITMQGISGGTPITETNSAAILAAIQGDVPSVTGPLSAAAAAATKSLMVGGQYLTTQPTMTNTQQGAILLSVRGSQYVVPGVENFAVQATLAAETTKVIGTVRNADGSGVLQVGDPCQTVAKTYTPISITTATTTRIVAPTSAKKTYVCYMYLQTTAANNIAVVEGTGGTCGSSTAGVVGGTTAANGLNNAANSGQAFGNGGYAALATAGTNVDLCLITSAATPLAGHVVWVAQ